MLVGYMCLECGYETEEYAEECPECGTKDCCAEMIEVKCKECGITFEGFESEECPECGSFETCDIDEM